MLDLYFNNPSDYLSFGHSTTHSPSTFDFHLHENFEIYFFISGNVNYFIEKRVYPLKYGDLLLINNHEIHRPTFEKGKIYERIVFNFDQNLISKFNAPTFNLLNCFINRPIGEKNKITLSKPQLNEIIVLFKRYEQLHTTQTTGNELLKLTCFLDILVLINKAFKNMENYELPFNTPANLVPILEFIDSNLEGDLSLEFLENHFFIDRFHLSRMFKKHAGSTIHEYIIYKRISKAKQLLSDGFNVTEVCNMSGFNDYSNFIRMFKRTVGISPGKYQKR